MRFWGRKEAESFGELRRWSEHDEQLWKEGVRLSCTWTGMALRIFTTSNCECLKMFACALLVRLIVLRFGHISSSTGLLFYSNNNLSVGGDPLHSTDERCSEEEDRCVKKKSSIMTGNGPWPATLKTTWHDHPILSFTQCHCSFSRWPVTYF